MCARALSACSLSRSLLRWPAASCCSFLFRIRKIITKLIINCRAMQFERIMLHSLQYSRSLLPFSLSLDHALSLCHFGDCDVGYLLIIALRLWPPLSAAFDLLNRKPKWLLVFVSVRFVFFPPLFRFDFSYFAFGCFCFCGHLEQRQCAGVRAFVA